MSKSKISEKKKLAREHKNAHKETCLIRELEGDMTRRYSKRDVS